MASIKIQESQNGGSPIVCNCAHLPFLAFLGGGSQRVVSKRVVLADVPLRQKLERGDIRMFPRYHKPERGYIRMSPGTKNRKRGHIRRNHRDSKPPFCFLSTFGPLSKGNFRRKITTIVGGRGQLQTSPPFAKPPFRLSQMQESQV